MKYRVAPLNAMKMQFLPLFRGLEAKIRIICREEILVHIWMVGKKFGPPWTLYTRAPNIDRNDARIYTFVYLRSINWSNILVTLSYMSGVVPGPPAQVEEPVAFSTQITTAVAEDDSKCFSIIVIMASRPFRSTNTTTALTTTQTFYMISVKHTKGSYSRP